MVCLFWKLETHSSCRRHHGACDQVAPAGPVGGVLPWTRAVSGLMKSFFEKLHELHPHLCIHLSSCLRPQYCLLEQQ